MTLKPGNPVGRPVTKPCGTPDSTAAYKRALRRKKKGLPHCGPCDHCKAEWATWQREYDARTKGQ